MRMLVVGAGATGGYFGGRLAEAGRNVTFLVRPGRAAQLRAGGLQIVSPHGNAGLAPRLVTAQELAGPFDVVLLTVKAYALEAALSDMAPAVGPGTMIVPILNGMRHLDVLAGRFGAGRVIGGVCRIIGTLDGAGRVVQLTPLHDLAYGELDGARTERIASLDAFMRGAVFNARLSSDITLDMWEKWLFLSALGGITCLMRGTVGEIAAAPGGLDFANGFFDEVLEVVRTVGREPSDAIVAGARAMLTAQGSALTSSMYRDLEKGGPIEADQIIGDLLARGQGAGLKTPFIAAAYAQLKIHQARSAAA